jgi:hypothetical protein
MEVYQVEDENLRLLKEREVLSEETLEDYLVRLDGAELKR